MLEIFILTLCVLGLAKHPKRRKYRRYLRGNIDLVFALLTLADNDVSIQANSESVTETTWLSSVKLIWAVRDFVAGEGPVYVGIAHSDYSSAEIEEWLENTASWSQGDLVQQEVAKRKIKMVGVFDFKFISSTQGLQAEKLNDGKPITTKCNWMLSTGQSIDLWAFNKSGAALQTGAVISVEGHANLWPR